jgi:serine/threonine protein kinase
MPSIGKYEILEQLGSGSMGTVYRGRDTVVDRTVAIKTLRTGVNVELEAKERFYREARTCARLNHPHIVSVYELGEENGISFIAMELLSGSDFRQLIDRREEMALPTKLTAFAQIAEALAHAHREGIVHRDIKPSNLFLLADGSAKVADFGIAKLPTSHLTRAGAILGTPNYMAPEQINGSPCDGRADLFSAAVVFFELLTFQHPFKSNLIPRRILEDPPDLLLECDPTLPPILEKVFARALAKDPSRRYATGDEFAADLRSVADALALNASPEFSPVVLPSQTSFAVPPAIPASSDPVSPVLGNTAAGDQEWRVNRMLKLLPMFDKHIESRDSQASRNTLNELQSVAGSDPRFQETVERCRMQLALLECNRSGRVVSAAPSSSKNFGTVKKCSKCNTVNRPDSILCIDCGVSLSAEIPGPPPESALSPTSGEEPEAVNWPRPMPPATKLAADRKRLSIVVAGVGIAAVLLVIAPVFFRTVRHEPFVATARVAAPQVRVLPEKSDGAKEIVAKARGSEMNVLELPKSLSQDWVRVQAREGEVFSRPGFVRAADLTEWEAKDPSAALALARMSGPMEAGTDAELRAQIGRLNAVAASFPGKPAGGAASLDSAKLELILAKHAKESGQPAADWQTSLADLTNRVEDMRRAPALQAGSDDLLRQIHDLIAEKPTLAVTGNPAAGVPGGLLSGAPPVTPAPLTDAEIKALLQSAEQLRKDHRYNDARRVVLRALRSQRKNGDAQILLKKIDAAIELERSAQ